MEPHTVSSRRSQPDRHSLVTTNRVAAAEEWLLQQDSTAVLTATASDFQSFAACWSMRACADALRTAKRLPSVQQHATRRTVARRLLSGAVETSQEKGSRTPQLLQELKSMSLMRAVCGTAHPPQGWETALHAVACMQPFGRPIHDGLVEFENELHTERFTYSTLAYDRHMRCGSGDLFNRLCSSVFAVYLYLETHLALLCPQTLENSYTYITHGLMCNRAGHEICLLCFGDGLMARPEDIGTPTAHLHKWWSKHNKGATLYTFHNGTRTYHGHLVASLVTQYRKLAAQPPHNDFATCMLACLMKITWAACMSYTPPNMWEDVWGSGEYGGSIHARGWLSETATTRFGMPKEQVVYFDAIGIAVEGKGGRLVNANEMDEFLYESLIKQLVKDGHIHSKTSEWREGGKGRWAKVHTPTCSSLCMHVIMHDHSDRGASLLAQFLQALGEPYSSYVVTRDALRMGCMHAYMHLISTLHPSMILVSDSASPTWCHACLASMHASNSPSKIVLEHGRIGLDGLASFKASPSKPSPLLSLNTLILRILLGEQTSTLSPRCIIACHLLQPRIGSERLLIAGHQIEHGGCIGHLAPPGSEGHVWLGSKQFDVDNIGKTLEWLKQCLSAPQEYACVQHLVPPRYATIKHTHYTLDMGLFHTPYSLTTLLPARGRHTHHTTEVEVGGLVATQEELEHACNHWDI